MNNIKMLREQCGLTQQECAEIFGVKLRAWQTYEQGVSEPKFDILFKIANYFNVSLDYLLGRETEPKPLEQLAKINGLNITEEVLLEEYMKLDPQKRKVIIDFMKRGIKEAETREQKKTIKQKSTYTCGELEDKKTADKTAEQDAG